MAKDARRATRAEGFAPPRFDESRARRWLLIGLGVLWLLDALLQMQPGMFTMDMISTIMRPAATGNAAALTALIDWSIRLVTPHLVAFNWSIVAAQFVLGAALLSGRRRIVRAGLWASVAFSLLVWVFGEGLGQLLTGSATALTGAPGSAFFYAVASALLLLPAGTWSHPHGRTDAATWTVSLAFLLGAALQLSHVFWTGLGLEAPFGDAYMMPQPHALRAAINAVASLASRAPVALNATLIALFLGLGVLVVLRTRSRAAFWAMLALITVVWVFGQDAGMFWSGMATDPNSGPLLALLLASGHAGWQGGKRAAGVDGAHRAPTAPAPSRSPV